MPGDPFYYSAEWRKLRNAARVRQRAQALPCAYCGQPIQRGDRTIVDHRVPRRRAPHLALDLRNLQVLHHACHSKKTSWDDYGTAEPVNTDGYPEGWE